MPCKCYFFVVAMNNRMVVAETLTCLLFLLSAGFHRHHFVQDTKEDAHSDTQALPDTPHTTFLHAEGEVHPAELPRSPHTDPH